MVQIPHIWRNNFTFYKCLWHRASRIDNILYHFLFKISRFIPEYIWYFLVLNSTAVLRDNTNKFFQVEAYGGETQDLNFQLEVFPNGEEGEDNSDYVAVFLTSRRQEDLEVKYDFSVQVRSIIIWHLTFEN